MASALGAAVVTICIAWYAPRDKAMWFVFTTSAQAGLFYVRKNIPLEYIAAYLVLTTLVSAAVVHFKFREVEFTQGNAWSDVLHVALATAGLSCALFFPFSIEQRCAVAGARLVVFLCATYWAHEEFDDEPTPPDRKWFQSHDAWVEKNITRPELTKLYDTPQFKRWFVEHANEMLVPR